MEIFLDCDGVLADFVSASLAYHGRSEKHDDIKTWNYFAEWGMTPEEFWRPLRGRHFWANLKPYPWATELYTALKALGDVTIVTSPSDDIECASGKAEWLDFHLGIRPEDCFIGKKKHLLSGNGVLVDDSESQWRMFVNTGGRCVLFPQPWNCAQGKWFDVVGSVKSIKEVL